MANVRYTADIQNESCYMKYRLSISPFCCSGAEVSDCGNYLIVTPQQDCRDNLVFFADLTEPLKSGLSGKLTLTPVVTTFEADYIVRISNVV